MATVSKGGANGQPWWERSSSERGHVHILDLFQATLAKIDTSRLSKLNTELVQAHSWALSSFLHGPYYVSDLASGKHSVDLILL